MGKKELIEQAYNRGKTLTLDNPMYLERVKDFTDRFLIEDTYENGDVTSKAVIENNIIKAQVKSKSSGIIAGLQEATWFYEQHGICFRLFKKDGQKISKGEKILELEGPEQKLLETERVGLNLLQHMSSIATTTKNIISSTKVKIAATRKTRWGLLDKRAIFIGGGYTHRLGLWEAILIKDTHLDAIRNEGIDNYIEVALERASKVNTNFIEIEVENKEDALRAENKFIELGIYDKVPCLIMFDNFSPKLIKETLADMKHKDKLIIEGSGGINPDNIAEFEDSGVDIVSMGFLTYSKESVDLSQKIIRKK